MKCMPLRFQCAHLICERRSILSASRAFSNAMIAWRFLSGTPTLLLYVRALEVAVAAIVDAPIFRGLLGKPWMICPAGWIHAYRSAEWIRASIPASIPGYRTRLCNIRVQLLDYVVILPFDNASFQLHGESKRTVVEGKVVRQQGKTLDGFILREMRGKPFDLRFDQRTRERMSGDFGVGRKPDLLLGSLGGHRHRIRNHDGGDEFPPVTHHHGVENIRTRLQRVFDRLRRHEFSRSRLDQVFFPIGNKEIAVFVDVPDVAGVEPAVVGENFARGFGTLVVTLHNTWALSKNFAVFGNVQQHVANGFPGTA